MAYSESAMQGVKANGRAWKATIYGLPAINDRIRELVDLNTAESIKLIPAEMQKIAALFKRHMNEENASYGEQEAIEWFEYQTPEWEFENETMDEWVQEFDYQLNELYDFADYNRIWVDPST